MNPGRLLSILLLIIFFSCGSPSSETAQLKKENAELRRENDSLKNTRPADDSILNKKEQLPPDRHVTAKKDSLTGRHDFTLQWIGWDRPGSVIIQAEENGWHPVKGKQKNAKNGDYITINGRIKQISALELLFEGEIISVIKGNNGGKPCVKKGQQLFKSTQKRKYWRMQDMINCEGGMLTDYVDIYF